MRILLIYHFFHPDTVISARMFTGLAEGLSAAGHEVTVFTGNRLMENEQKLPPEEIRNGVKIRRFSRPGFKQKNKIGRLLNSAILQLKWLNAFRKDGKTYDAVILGTDPQFGYLMFPWFRLMNRRVKLIHWAFDLFPEAILVDSAWWMRLLAGMMKPLAWLSYRFVNYMIDIGGCMQKRLQKYHHKAVSATLTPWALVEPDELPAVDPEVRKKLFGNAKLGLLYSGTVGQAHELSNFIALARKCRERQLDVAFCFAGHGNCFEKQTLGITAQDTNIRLMGFATEEELAKRLESTDFNMISLRQGWEGIVVPSKFFGSLATGRPVLFDGPEHSCITQWCKQLKIGQKLDNDTNDTVDFLAGLLQDEGKLTAYKERAFKCYQEQFSKKIILSRWLELLQK